MKFYIIIFGVMVLAGIIAVIDYLWYGKKIKSWTKEQIIFFYFTRTIGELIALTLGIIIGLKLGEF